MAGGDGLSDAYQATLTRIRAQKGIKSILALKALMWVLYSERPLKAEELCDALGVEMGATDLDPENVPPLRRLLASCLGLVTLEASSSTVTLVHFTLQEYLLRDTSLFHSPHSTIAEVCLTYLNSESVRSLSPTLRSAPSTMPLLEYASCYWAEHARRGMTEKVKALALRLLDGFDKHISAQLALLHYNKYLGNGSFFDTTEGPAGFTGLHGAAFLGIADMVTPVLDLRKWDVNAADYSGSTALTWAAQRGHEGVVKALLERGDVNPDLAEPKYGRAPLWVAAAEGHRGVVKIFLERDDVDPNQADTEYGATPLSRAAEKGHEGVIKVLLEREDVNPNQADIKHGRTPLSWAAESGNEGVVRILLEWDEVCSVMPDNSNQTPLSLALSAGHVGVARILQERDGANSYKVDHSPHTLPRTW